MFDITINQSARDLRFVNIQILIYFYTKKPPARRRLKIFSIKSISILSISIIMPHKCAVGLANVLCRTQTLIAPPLSDHHKLNDMLSTNQIAEDLTL